MNLASNPVHSAFSCILGFTRVFFRLDALPYPALHSAIKMLKKAFSALSFEKCNHTWHISFWFATATIDPRVCLVSTCHRSDHTSPRCLYSSNPGVLWGLEPADLVWNGTLGMAVDHLPRLVDRSIDFFHLHVEVFLLNVQCIHVWVCANETFIRKCFFGLNLRTKVLYKYQPIYHLSWYSNLRLIDRSVWLNGHLL